LLYLTYAEVFSPRKKTTIHIFSNRDTKEEIEQYGLDYWSDFYTATGSRSLLLFEVVPLTNCKNFGIFQVPNDLCGEGTLLLGNC